MPLMASIIVPDWRHHSSIIWIVKCLIDRWLRLLIVLICGRVLECRSCSVHDAVVCDRKIGASLLHRIVAHICRSIGILVYTEIFIVYHWKRKDTIGWVKGIMILMIHSSHHVCWVLCLIFKILCFAIQYGCRKVLVRGSKLWTTAVVYQY